MKTLSLLILGLFMTITTAFAGINGTYKVKGTEFDGYRNYTFSGTVVLKKGRNYTVSLFYNDGDTALVRGKFPRALKENKKSQKVSFFPIVSGTKANGTVLLKKTKSGYTMNIVVTKGPYLLKGTGKKGK